MTKCIGEIQLTNKTGWPWDVEILQFSITMADGSPWPKISLVTPSFNQAEFIEETIRSVIMQGYPNLEYIIIDGGSTDGSIEIIKKYEEHLAYWVSEPDQGQAHAINKGFRISTGDIIGWINSDDFYHPQTFNKVARFFIENKEEFIYGMTHYIDENSNVIGTFNSKPLPNNYRKYTYWRAWNVPQPSVFFRKVIFDKYGYLDENLNYSLDYEFFLRISQSTHLYYYPELLSYFRKHIKSKSGVWKNNKKFFFKENQKINKKFNKFPQLIFWELLFDQFFFYPIEKIVKFFLRQLKRVFCKNNHTR